MYPFAYYKKNYLLGADGKYHEVAPAVYQEYMRSINHEKYCEKRDRSPVRTTKDSSSASTGRDSLPRVVSMDSITESHGEAILPWSRSAEEYALEQMAVSDVSSSLDKVLDSLKEDEKDLIQKIFFEEMSFRDYSALTGIPRTTLQSRMSVILRNMKASMATDIKGCSPEMIQDVINYER